jgi:hypothetical protein
MSYWNLHESGKFFDHLESMSELLGANEKICRTDKQTDVGADGKSRNGVTHAPSNHSSQSTSVEWQGNAHSI